MKTCMNAAFSQGRPLPLDHARHDSEFLPAILFIWLDSKYEQEGYMSLANWRQYRYILLRSSGLVHSFTALNAGGHTYVQTSSS